MKVSHVAVLVRVNLFLSAVVNCDIVTLLTDGRIRIENLKPDTNYTLSVRAKNEVGVGPQKQITVATETISTSYLHDRSKIYGFIYLIYQSTA